jgi:hypothetical protein
MITEIPSKGKCDRAAEILRRTFKDQWLEHFLEESTSLFIEHFIITGHTLIINQKLFLRNAGRKINSKGVPFPVSPGMVLHN